VSRFALSVAVPGASSSSCACERDNHLPVRVPLMGAPLMLHMVRAVERSSKPFSAASGTSLRTAAGLRLIDKGAAPGFEEAAIALHHRPRQRPRPLGLIPYQEVIESSGVAAFVCGKDTASSISARMRSSTRGRSVSGQV